MLYHKDTKSRLLHHRDQHGMVVIAALFIVAIIAAMSYAMLASLTRDTHRTEMILHDLALTYYAEGGIHWAEDVLATNLLKKTPDNRIDTIPIVSPVNEENGYRIASRIYDMQSRYNINRLAGSEAERKDEFVRLLTALNIKLEPKKRDLLIDAIRDWISESEGRPDLNRYYQELSPPYRAGHQLMAHISELRLVKGMTAEIYTKLAPYLVALPINGAAINLYTASPPVLTTLNKELTLDKAAALSKAVASINTSDPARLEKIPLLANLNVKSAQFTIVSEYFLVETMVSVESQQLVIYTLMERKPVDANKVDIKIIWQSKGVA